MWCLHVAIVAAIGRRNDRRDRLLMYSLQTTSRRDYTVQQKKYSLELSAIFRATAWNYNSKFYTLITRLYLHIRAKRHLILFCFCNVTEFFVRRRRDFARSTL